MSIEDDAQFVKKTDSANQDEQIPDPLPIKAYYATNYAYIIVSKKWVIFTLIAGIIYSYHLLWTIHGVDKYADNTRLLTCTEAGQPDYFKTPKETESDEEKGKRIKKIQQYEADQGEKSSQVLDGAILLVTIYHMIEWIRWTFYLTMALVGVNLMKLYYLLSLNILFGVIAVIIAIFTAMSEEGKLCRETHQQVRGDYLANQWIVAVLYIPFSFAHFLFFSIKGNKWCNETYYAEEEEEEE